MKNTGIASLKQANAAIKRDAIPELRKTSKN